MRISDAQRVIKDTYIKRDMERGLEKTFLWLVEEIGELAEAIRAGGAGAREEFADVFAWLISVANLAGVDLEEAFKTKYGRGCPRCYSTPCRCGPDPP